MKSLRIAIMALVALAVVGVLAFTPIVPKALAALSEAQLAPHPVGQIADTAQNDAVRVALPAASSRSGSAALAGDLQSTLEQVYENSKDSVVNIQVTVSSRQAQGSQNGRGFGQMFPQLPGMPDFNQPFQSNPGGNSLQDTPVAQAEGSGFVWDTQGHIVTNNHVVDGASTISVTFADGNTVAATLVGADPDSDLAVIKVDPAGLTLKPAAVGDSTAVKVGQFTAAIGNPFGLEGTLTFGIVSAVDRSMPARQGNNILSSNQPSYTIPDIIQTDTPINPGNSGGVLLDMDGKLIGVPTAIESQVGQSAGVGFAVPSSLVSKVVPALIRDGKVEHPWLGLSGTTLTSDLAQAMKLPATQRGALVADVTQGGPADKAGVHGSTEQTTINGRESSIGGDVITAINGQTVRTFDDLVTYLARDGQVGQTITLRVLRDGKEMTLNVSLGSRPTEGQATPSTNSQQPSQRGQGNSSGGTAWLGISGLTLTQEIARQMGLAQSTQGVLVESVAPQSPAAQAGLVAGNEAFTTSDGQEIQIGGDIITAINGRRVSTVQQLTQQIGRNQPGQKATLTILRGGEQQQVTVTLATRPSEMQ